MAADARSGYLRRLAALAVGEAPVLVPRLPNRFADSGDDDWREEIAESPSRPVPPPAPRGVEGDVTVRRPQPPRDGQQAPLAALPAAAPPRSGGDATTSRRAGPDLPAVPAFPAEPARLPPAATNPPPAEVRIVHEGEPAAAPRPEPVRAAGRTAPAASVRAVAPAPPAPASTPTRRPPAVRPSIGHAVEISARRRPPEPAPVTVRIGRVEVTVAPPAPAPAPVPAPAPERIGGGDDSAAVPDLSTYLRDPYARGQGTRR
jgi:hypothetical protein